MTLSDSRTETDPASGDPVSGDVVARSAFWRMAEAVGGEGLALLLFVVLARLLAPEHFGVVSLAGVLIMGGQVILQQGIPGALIQGGTPGRARLDTAFWCSLGIGAGLMGLFILLARPIAAVFGEPALAPVLAALALVLPVTAATAVYQARLMRRMAFAVLAIRALVAVGLGGLAALGLALAGFGAWALVAQQIVNAAAGLVIFALFDGWRPGWRFDRQEARNLFAFSLPLMGTHLSRFSGKKLDLALLAPFAAAATIGHYFLATRLIQALGLATFYLLFALALPVLSRLKDRPDAFAAAAQRTLWLTTALCLPAGLGLALIADPLVPLVFGEAWREAVPILQLLAVFSVFYGLGLIIGQILVAAGDPGACFRLTLANTGLFILLVAAAAPMGPLWVALAAGLANLLMLPAYLSLLVRRIGLTIGAIIRSQRPLWCAAGIMAAAVAATLAGASTLLGTPAALPLAVLAGVASFLGALWVLDGATVRDVLASITGGRGGAPADALRSPA